MHNLESDILALWQLMDKHKTKYLVVGGFANTFNGFIRLTNDLDLWIKDTLDNRRSLQNVLKESGIVDLKNIETIAFTSLPLSAGIELDIMTDLKGLDQSKFDECYKIAPTAFIKEIPVKFLHINQLIEAKKASGRPKDLWDVEELEKIRKHNNNK